MNTFEPGRVYSGIVDGKRQIVFCDSEHWHHVDAAGVLCGGGHFNGSYTDVRGPLVVLDDPHAPMNAVALALREAGFDYLAHQIEEQTRPPLQVGWHEVEDCRRSLYWDGDHWSIGPWAECPTASQGYLSTHYIGPGSQS